MSARGMMILADVSWPLLLLATIGVLLVATWPATRRLVHNANVLFAEGLISQSLVATLKAHRSMLPLPVLQRLLFPGADEMVIAARYQALDRLEDAIEWCNRGLRRARKPAIKARLHGLAAEIFADLNDPAQCERHLGAMKALLDRHPQPDLLHSTVAISCHLRLGQIERAIEEFRESLERPCHVGTVDAGTHALYAAGMFNNVFRLTWGLLDQEGGPASGAHEADTLGVQAARSSAAIRQRSNLAAYGMLAAMDADRWDLYARYLQAAGPADHSLPTRLVRRGFEMLLAAHEGRRTDVEQAILDIKELASRDPENLRRIQTTHSLIADAWALLGHHERALASLHSAPRVHPIPFIASSTASRYARSLEALGRVEEARAYREEARRLAPLAFWNRPRNEWSLSDDSEMSVRFGRLTVQPEAAPVSEFADTPVTPVASWLSIATWIVTPLAMIPVAGAPPALALLVLGAILLIRSGGLPHDRRVGSAAVILAVLSLLLATSTLAMSWKVTNDRRAEYKRLAARLTTMPYSRPASASLPASTAADGQEAQALKSEPADETEFEELDTGEFNQSAQGPRLRDEVLLFAVLIVSIMLHEIGHAMAAYWGGDPTARDAGRFSLNPIRHIDPVGSIIVPLVLSLLPGGQVIGWAKPVPVRLARLRRPRMGPLAVSLAGVSMNLALALAASSVLAFLLALIKWLYPRSLQLGMVLPLHPVKFLNLPHDTLWAAALSVCAAGIVVNVLLAGFNLLPLPPLDGFGVLHAIAPRPLRALLGRLSGMGLILFMLLIAFDKLNLLLAPAAYVAALLLAFGQVITSFL